MTPLASGLHGERAERLLEIGRYREALTAVRRQLAAGERGAAPWLLAARAHLGLREWTDALDAAGTTLRLDPGEVGALMCVSVALLELGRDAEAYAAAVEATRRAPDAWLAHYCVAAAGVRLADRSRPDRQAHRRIAAQAADQAVRLAPDEAMTHLMVGVVAVNAGRSRDATAALTRALELDPQNDQAHFHLGLVRIDRGNIAGGVRALDAAGRVNPQETLLWDAYDALVRRWLVSVHIGFFLLYHLTRLTGELDRPGPNPAWPWLFAGMTAVLVGWTWYSLRGLGGRAGPVLRRVLRGWPATAVWLIALGCAYLASAVLCLSPSPDVRRVALYVTVAAVVVCVVVCVVAVRVMNRRLAAAARR